MDIFLQLLTDWGYFGMFLSAFLAGTILPFSSEAVLLACVGLGLDPIWSTIATTAGNVFRWTYLLLDRPSWKNGMDRKIPWSNSETNGTCYPIYTWKGSMDGIILFFACSRRCNFNCIRIDESSYWDCYYFNEHRKAGSLRYISSSNSWYYQPFLK